jgi:hypothetical protein
MRCTGSCTRSPPQLTAADFRGAIRQVLQLARDGRAPILHFETHGDQEGIEVGSGERIAWSELARELSAINEACRMNLLVVAAACNGWFLGSVLRPVQRSPAWGIMGPPDTVGHRDLTNAMHRFYADLLKTIDLSKALRAANVGLSMLEGPFRITSAELLFCRVFQYYMRDLDGVETVEQRTRRIVAEIARVRNLDVRQTMTLRSDVLRDITDHRRWYAYYRERFLMLDLFPENKLRFSQTFDQCIGSAA